MSIGIDDGASLVFKRIPVEDLMDLIDRTSVSMGDGTGMDEIRKGIEEKRIGPEGADMIIDICMTRKKASSKFPGLRSPFFTSEGLRWATPQFAADHCADRLERDLVMDLTCGQGGQVLSLARTCDRVIAFDIDPLNCLLTRMNAISLDIDNVEILNMDSLSDKALSRAEKGCAVFSDPARPPGAVERSMDELLPDPRKIEDRYRSKVEGFCFEVPPYLSLDKVPFDCEAEYVSIDGRINRLNLYLGDLKKDDRSAVILPEGDRIAGSPMGRLQEIEDRGDLRFMNEVDPSLVKAGLIELLITDLDGKIERMDMDKRRTMLLSTAPISSPFIKESFKILGRSKDLSGVKRLLEDVEARSVTLRFPVEPSEYWNVRNGLEKDLSGTIKTQLFKGEDHILTSKVEKRRHSR